MSRGQEQQVINEAQAQNAQQAANAQTSYTQAQGDVAQDQNQLGQFAAANPYGAGGEFQTSQNKIDANTSDAAALAAGQAMQGAAVRTGQNAGSAVAATQATEQANERNLSGQEAQQNAQRIQDQAGYNQQVLNATATPAQIEAGLTATESKGAEGDLGVQQDASKQPGFLDSLGNAFTQGVGSFMQDVGSNAASGLKGIMGGCWIAAELYGGWEDPRVILLRVWLHTEFRKRWYGPVVLWAYHKWGAQVAAAIRKPKNHLWRDAFKELFDVGVEQSEQWHDANVARMNATMGLEVGWKEGLS
jgi:hypothetical protein